MEKVDKMLFVMIRLEADLFCIEDLKKYTLYRISEEFLPFIET